MLKHAPGDLVVEHNIRGGLKFDIPNGPIGTPIDASKKVSQVALLGEDYIDLKARIIVTEGSYVKRGQPLFEDRRNTGIFITSPISGLVTSIERGEKRSLKKLIIEPQNDEQLTISSNDAKELLLKSGLWASIKERPFGKIPSPTKNPAPIFINACQEQPLAPSPITILKDREDFFSSGIRLLNQLCPKVYLCVDSTDFPTIIGIETHLFKGTWAAKTSGIHIHTISPADISRPRWQIRLEDVISIGKLVETGVIDLTRLISIAGPGYENPHLAWAPIGSKIEDLTGKVNLEKVRVISGSVFHGGISTHLGRYTNQITIIPRDNKRTMFGWLGLGLQKYSEYRLFLSKLFPSKATFNTSQNGEARPIIPTGAYEKAMAFDIPAIPFLRAIESSDLQLAENMGCLELLEEDLAPLSFICPGKRNYGESLRSVLRKIEES